MSCIISEVKVSDLNFDETKTKVSAEVEVFFTLDEEDHLPVAGSMKHKICICVNNNAPENRILRRLRTSAVQRQRAYFEGDDDTDFNLFTDVYETTQ